MRIDIGDPYSKEQLERFLRKSEKITYLTSALAVFVFVSGTLAAVGVLIYQIGIWRETRSWESLPGIDVLPQILPSDFFLWLNNESSWLALKKTIIGIAHWPLSLFLWLICLPGVWVFATIAHVERWNAESSRRRLAKLEKGSGVDLGQLQRKGNRRLAATDRRTRDRRAVEQ